MLKAMGAAHCPFAFAFPFSPRGRCHNVTDGGIHSKSSLFKPDCLIIDMKVPAGISFFGWGIITT